MNFLKIVVLGAVQGLTEFLPVSSDGHLSVFRHLLKIPPDIALALDVSLHAGTLGSMLLFFRKDVLRLFRSLFQPENSLARALDRRRVLFILLATGATAVTGFGLKHAVERVEGILLWTAVGFLGTTVYLLLGELGGKSRVRTEITEAPLWNAVVMGLVQGAAVWPGLSRSASTIGTALFLGWTWEESGRLSFIMAIPAVMGATLLEAKEIAGLPDLPAAAAGALVSFFVGLGALAFLMRFLKARKLWPFAVYTSLMAIYAFKK